MRTSSLYKNLTRLAASPLKGRLEAVLILLMIVMGSCNRTPSDKVRIKGHFEHLQVAQMYIYADDGRSAKIDTINVVNGDFRYQCTITEPTILCLVYPNYSEAFIVAEPGKTLKYKADVSNLRHAEVEGTEANDSLTAFRKRYAAEPIEAQQKAAEQFIRKNPASLASVALFLRYFERAEVLKAEPTQTLLTTLCKAHPSLQGLASVRSRLTPLLKTAVGAKISSQILPADSLPAVVLFTRSTQHMSNEMLRNATPAATERGVHIKQVKTDEADLDSLRLRYGMRYIPGNLIINRQGRITQRDVPSDRLERAIKEL